MEQLEKLIDDLTHKRIDLTTGFTLAKKLNLQFKDEGLASFIENETKGYAEVKTDGYPKYRIIPAKKKFIIANPFNGVQQTVNLDIPITTILDNGESTDLKYIGQKVSELESLISGDKHEALVVQFSGNQLGYSNRYFSKNFDSQGWGIIKGTFEFSRAQFESIYQSIRDQLIEELIRIQSLYPTDNPTSKLFGKGSHFDATLEISKILKSASIELIIIDNYIDENVLNLLTDVKQTVKIKYLTNQFNLKPSFKPFYQSHVKQYKNVEIKYTNNFHDRFIIVDNAYYYQCGASLKDLGNKVFMFVKIDEPFIQNALITQFNQEWI
jgi:hypothetical protein